MIVLWYAIALSNYETTNKEIVKLSYQGTEQEGRTANKKVGQYATFLCSNARLAHKWWIEVIEILWLTIRNYVFSLISSLIATRLA